jgi:hypothetical protein
MASPETDTIKGLLQALESTMDDVDKLSALAGQLLAAQRDNKPLSPTTLRYYGEKLEELSKQRAHMRTLIAKWWTLVEGVQ